MVQSHNNSFDDLIQFLINEFNRNGMTVSTQNSNLIKNYYPNFNNSTSINNILNIGPQEVVEQPKREGKFNY